MGFPLEIGKEHLPTCNSLQSKNIQVDNRCYFCGHNEKIVWHLFLQCPYTKTIIITTRIDIKETSNTGDLIMRLNYLKDLILTLDLHDFELLAGIWDRIWYQRNMVSKKCSIPKPSAPSSGCFA